MPEWVVGWVFPVALSIIAVMIATPFAVAAIRKRNRRKRQKLVNSRRTIAVTSGAKKRVECSHLRSKSRARAQEDGSYQSVCKVCGVAMIKSSDGTWRALNS